MIPALGMLITERRISIRASKAGKEAVSVAVGRRQSTLPSVLTKVPKSEPAVLTSEPGQGFVS